MKRQVLRLVDTARLRAVPRPGGLAGRGLGTLTRASDGAGLWLAEAAVLGAAGGRRGRRAAARALGAVAVTSTLVNGPLKVLVRRRRPGRLATAGFERTGRGPTTSSFPSGHTATGFAFAVAAGTEAPVLAAPLLATAALVGWSRLHGGRHFPSDVLAGAALGAAVGLAVHAAGRRMEGGTGGRTAEAGPAPPVCGAAHGLPRRIRRRHGARVAERAP